jgi:hypothetical protein
MKRTILYMLFTNVVILTFVPEAPAQRNYKPRSADAHPRSEPTPRMTFTPRENVIATQNYAIEQASMISPEERKLLNGIKINEISVTINIERLRELLGPNIPKDGEVITHIIKKNHFKGFLGKQLEQEYERHEYAEFSLATIIRAKPQHRNKDDGDGQPIRSFPDLKPITGIVARDGYLLVQGGWRAKMEGVDLGPFGRTDHYDGTFRLRVYLELNRGKLHCRVEKEDVTWNGSGVEGFLDGLLFGKMDEIVTGVVAKCSEELNQKAEDALTKLSTDYPLVKVLRKFTNISVTIDGIKVTIKTP